MICFNCKKQIPDGVSVCPNCNAPVNHPVQVVKEVRFRRKQRWFLYGVIIVVFVGMLIYVIKVYADNTKLVNSITQYQTENASLNANLTDRQNRISQLEQNVSEGQKALNQKTEEFKNTLADQLAILERYEQFRVSLGTMDANVYALLIQSGIGISNKELANIPIADYNLASGVDTDKDGLSDAIEASLGTDKNKADSDGDGYSDKEELSKGYNPSGAGKLSLDSNIIQKYRGSILLQIEGNKEAWYLNPKDNKRYFLGIPDEVIKQLKELESIK